MNASQGNSFTVPLDAEGQERLVRELKNGNYRPLQVPHARVAGERPACRIILYESGKCLVQGKGAADWVAFVLEPTILGKVITGYEAVLDPEAFTPHMGIDESGKGDFFGPLVVAAVYTDGALVDRIRSAGARDSKAIGSDARIGKIAQDIRHILHDRFAVVTIGPRAYNRLYAEIGNVNKLLAWAHARAIENLLERVPGCPRAVVDKFGPERQIREALLRNGRRLTIEQRPRAESDPAVAAASILARDGFVAALRKMSETLGMPVPKGASEAVQAAAESLVRAQGPAVLVDAAKCHFRTADSVLARAGTTREALGPLGHARSRSASSDRNRVRPAEGSSPGTGPRPTTRDG